MALSTEERAEKLEQLKELLGVVFPGTVPPLLEALYSTDGAIFVPAPPEEGTHALQSIEGVLTWVEVVE